MRRVDPRTGEVLEETARDAARRGCFGARARWWRSLLWAGGPGGKVRAVCRPRATPRGKGMRGPLEAQLLEQRAVAVQRHAPLLIVVPPVTRGRRRPTL